MANKKGDKQEDEQEVSWNIWLCSVKSRWLAGYHKATSSFDNLKASVIRVLFGVEIVSNLHCHANQLKINTIFTSSR